MTGEQKQNIQELRRQGFSLTHISETLGLSVNTIKSFCRRNDLKVGEQPTACDASNDTGNEDYKENIENEAIKENKEIEYNKDTCKQCGERLVHKEKSKAKTFCNDKCRLDWWKTHRDKVTKKAVYTITCACCGTVFESYANKKRKYCCHACYIKGRFGEAQHREAVMQT